MQAANLELYIFPPPILDKPGKGVAVEAVDTMHAYRLRQTTRHATVSTYCIVYVCDAFVHANHSLSCN